MPPAEFEPEIPACDVPQTFALYRLASGIGALASLPYDFVG